MFMEKKVKFGAYKYQTENIGDNIQTLAMMRFVPHVDYFFDRDNINATKINKDDQVKLIANGWYMHHRDGVFDWPPKDPNLQPLLISMYLERDVDFNRADLAFFTDESRAFLKKFGPVGARDIGTQKFLTENGIECYLSGCLTLTLLPDDTIPKQDYILAVDVSDKVYDFILSKTKRRVVRMNTNIGYEIPNEDKLFIAKYWLSLYQSAHCVVTTRLHTMLPCLALGTPVLAIRKGDNHRFEGLIDLANSTTEVDLLDGKIKYDFDQPKKNPDSYLEYANKLIKDCKTFTGYDSKQSFLCGQTYMDFLTSPELAQAITGLAAESLEGCLRFLKLGQLEARVKSQNDKITQLEAVIAKCNVDITNLNQPGIKQSMKNLAKASIRKLKKMIKQ